MELTVIIVGNNAREDILRTKQSVADQTFTDYETVCVSDEYSALKYIGDGMIKGDHVLFLRAGDILAAQMTVEENIRILRETDCVDIVFFPWGNTENGYPHTYDKYCIMTREQDPDKIEYAISLITCSQLYGKLFRKRLFNNLDFQEYMGFTPELMSVLVFAAKGLCWSPNGLYFYRGRRNDYIDDFRFIYNLLVKQCNRMGRNSKIFANCFFAAMNRMLRLMKKHDAEPEAEKGWLVENIPSFTCLFHGMKKRYKRDLLLIKVLGYDRFMKRQID